MFSQRVRPIPVTGVRLSLWRAAVAFRIVTAVVCEYLILRWHQLYARPLLAVAVGLGIAAVTVVITVLGLAGRAHRRSVVLADFVVVVALTLLTGWAQAPAQAHGQMPTLTTVWAAGPVIEAGLVSGWLGGLLLALGQFGAALLVRDGYDGNTLKNGVLLLITGGISGYLTMLTTQAERERAALAALAERDRLTRSIHDGVLQVLALVHRKASTAGADWAAIGQAAAEQEIALRGLLNAPVTDQPAGRSDLMAALVRLRSSTVTVAVPATPLLLATPTVTELLAIVQAALHNVQQHAGTNARAWVSAEHLADRVCLSVRDDGAGFPVARLAEAEAAGRLGVASSIRGRVTDLGGRVRIDSAPGQGTEIDIELGLARLEAWPA